jgi:hypothetical protein
MRDGPTSHHIRCAAKRGADSAARRPYQEQCLDAPHDGESERNMLRFFRCYVVVETKDIDSHVHGENLWIRHGPDV